MVPMLSLAIESTAHTFGVGIVDDKKHVLANVKDSYTTEAGGIKPDDAKQHHLQVKDRLVAEALAKAGLTMEDIGVIAVSQGPGLPPCLVVGMEKAKELAREYKKPLVGVNHCIAHLEIGRALSRANDPVLLYVSGANTQIIAYDGGKYRIVGETLDNGVGNFLDKFARILGLGFPGGPKIDALAKQGKEYIELPYTVKGMDIAVGGLLTNLQQKVHAKKYTQEDLAFSAQETVFAMLMEVAERAMHHCQKRELVLGGGVCCNTRLREMAELMCKANNFRMFTVPNEFLVDNGAMIAWTGLLQFQAGMEGSPDSMDIRPRERTDDVEVRWR